MAHQAKSQHAVRMISEVLTNELIEKDEKRRLDEPGVPLDPLGILRPVKTKYRLLTKEESLELGRRIQEENDIEARNLLVLHNVRLAIYLANKYRFNDIGMDFNDRLQEAIIGLIIAADKYDYKLGFSFTTYATWWIRQNMGRVLQDTKNMIREPVHIQELRSRVRRASGELATEYKRPPTTKEIALRLNIDESKVVASLKRLQIPIVSFDSVLSSRYALHQSHENTVGDFIVDNTKLDALQMLEAREEMKAACAELEMVVDMLYNDNEIVDRNKQIFTYYYGFDGPLQGRTLDVTGERFGITRERIRQIVGRIWDQLDRSGLDMDHDRLVDTIRRIRLLETLTNEQVSME